jgi:hypothetical protein
VNIDSINKNSDGKNKFNFKNGVKKILLGGRFGKK